MHTALPLLFASAMLLTGSTAGGDISEAPQMAPMALNSYTLAPRNIVTASVLDLDGDVIGSVQKLDVDQTGKPQGLDVLLSRSGRVINVVGSNVSYEEGQNVVTVGLNRSQIAK
jgi:hypothetical protein